MTKDEARTVADAILKLVNSRPWTPSRDEITDLLLKTAPPSLALIPLDMINAIYPLAPN